MNLRSRPAASGCQPARGGKSIKRDKEGKAGRRRTLLHQLRLVYVCNPALQLLRMFGEELELGAVSFRVLPGVVIADLSWGTDERRRSKTWRSRSAAERGRGWGGEARAGGPGFLFPALSGRVARAGTSLALLMSPRKEQLTRQPIFNSSALRLRHVSLSAPLAESVCSGQKKKKQIWLWLTAFVTTAMHGLL